MLLVVKDVTKRFGGIVALQGVNLQIDVGEIVGIIGPNGAGKTTLLNIISGFQRADSGTVLFKDIDVSKLPHYKLSRLGIVKTFQIPKAFHSLTLYENCLVSISSREKHIDEFEHELEEILKLLKLHGKKDYFPSQLTSSELRLLEVARAVLLKPTLLLLDEPFAGLSMGYAERINILLSNLISESASVIVIEHNIHMVRQLVKRLVVMSEGKVIAEGEAEEILHSREVIEAYFGRMGVR
jgi:branched-chain amino acid transport system ATP-binding protein